ncbi:MAG: hypothetical protein H8D34_29765 [Chloroflexi bacterium]|nr:hypothetical protein [Chloroflexota bacterium]
MPLLHNDIENEFQAGNLDQSWTDTELKDKALSNHLPKPPLAEIEYRELHDDFIHEELHVEYFTERTDWVEIGIPADISNEEIYRLLPSAEDFEYGGYLTEKAILFIKGDESEVKVDKTKLCTFHTHPTSSKNADMPSPTDIYHFLKWAGGVRTITVGKKWIWVWDKTVPVMNTVKRLKAWEEENMWNAIQTFFQTEKDEDVFKSYYSHVLTELGLIWPENYPDLPAEEWSALLENCLSIKTQLILRVE